MYVCCWEHSFQQHLDPLRVSVATVVSSENVLSVQFYLHLGVARYLWDWSSRMLAAVFCKDSSPSYLSLGLSCWGATTFKDFFGALFSVRRITGRCRLLRIWAESLLISPKRWQKSFQLCAITSFRNASLDRLGHSVDKNNVLGVIVSHVFYGRICSMLCCGSQSRVGQVLLYW